MNELEDRSDIKKHLRRKANSLCVFIPENYCGPFKLAQN